jgi:hypothetical protein
LNVVRNAAVSCDSLSRRATVCLSFDIFTRVTPGMSTAGAASPLPDDAGAAAGAEGAGAAFGAAAAFLGASADFGASAFGASAFGASTFGAGAAAFLGAS